jgi:hypothetical protein
MLRLTKNGFAPWEKKLQMTGVNATIDAELEQQMVYKIR